MHIHKSIIWNLVQKEVLGQILVRNSINFLSINRICTKTKEMMQVPIPPADDSELKLLLYEPKVHIRNSTNALSSSRDFLFFPQGLGNWLSLTKALRFIVSETTLRFLYFHKSNALSGTNW